LKRGDPWLSAQGLEAILRNGSVAGIQAKHAGAVKVSGNWRVAFAFVGSDADHVDYEDYH
jgi:hypothetical protein